MKIFLKHCRYLLEWIAVVAFYYSCRLMPLALSSRVAGAFARWLGPKLGVSHIARRNLRLAFPCLKDCDRELIIGKMWENLGRTFGEYPHLATLNILEGASPLTIEGKENLVALKNTGRPVIFFLGHLANWEYATMPARRWGFDMAQLFRPLNNPYLARFITAVHQRIAPNLVTKGQKGARKMMAILKGGGHLSMLVDQKLNEGLAIPFFGVPAMTAPAIARLALRFNAFIVPVQVIRLHEHTCKVIYHPPLPMPVKGTDLEKTTVILTTINHYLEKWIRTSPQDWLWLHKRWPLRHEAAFQLMAGDE